MRTDGAGTKREPVEDGFFPGSLRGARYYSLGAMLQHTISHPGRASGVGAPFESESPWQTKGWNAKKSAVGRDRRLERG